MALSGFSFLLTENGVFLAAADLMQDNHNQKKRETARSAPGNNYIVKSPLDSG